jgi:hypothetical protein
MDGFHEYFAIFSVLTSALIDGRASAPGIGGGGVNVLAFAPRAAFLSISAL